MKTQLLKLVGASILAFSLSFLTFMSLTIAVQDGNEKQNATLIHAEQTYEDNITLVSASAKSESPF